MAQLRAPVMYLKTPEAARQLGIRYTRLISLLRAGKLAPAPAKDSSGDFVWTEADLVRARQAMTVDRRKKNQPKEGQP